MEPDNDNYEYQMTPEIQDYQMEADDYNKKVENWQENRPKKKPDQYYVEKLLEVLNTEPPKKFIEELEVGRGRTIKFIPIDKIRFLLTRTFWIYWKKEVRSGVQLLNASATIIRLHYKVPNTNIWLYHDGQGGKQFNLNSGSAASDLSQIQANAVMLAFPGSGSYALSNAAENLGILFGSNLNRKNPIDYMGIWNPDEDDDEVDNREQPKLKSNDTSNNQNHQTITADDLPY